MPVSSGLRGIRTGLLRLSPRRQDLRGDLVAGVPGAISSVPDGMAASILAGVSPVHGLYASMVGPIGGGLTASSRLMVITTTSAAALAAGSALESVSADDRPQALFLLTLIAGAVMVVAGLLRFGRYVRFVPHSVMIGFLTGVAVNIVFGQIPDLVGASVSGPFALAKFFDLVTHPSRIEPATTACGVAALVALFGLQRTRFATYSSLIALIVPSVVVALVGSTTIELVNDVGAIPQGLPAPYLPHLSDLSVALVSGALSVAALVLIQGAGVAESAPNPDGSRSDTNRDFHLAIARAGRNAYYTELFGRLLDEGRRLNRIYYASFDDHLPAEFVAEHEAIIQAIIDRDAERADSLARAHAGQVVRQIQGFLAGGVGGDVALGPAAEPPAASPPA